MGGYLIVLPSSEGKQPGGKLPPPGRAAHLPPGPGERWSGLQEGRERLVGALEAAAAEGEGLERLFGVAGRHLAAALDATACLRTGPVLPAAARYAPGVLYAALGAASMPAAERRALYAHTVIVSGLFGLLAPADPVPMYKLRMEAALPGVGPVAAFWRPRLSPALNRLAEEAVVWDLLPEAHRRAWDTAPPVWRTAVQVRFEEERAGVRRGLSHGVKALRGALARFVAAYARAQPARLAEWAAPGGFRLDAAATRWDAARREVVYTFVREVEPL